MDWDLWSAPLFDPEDNSLCKPLECPFGFYFHYGLDVIEEDALKEKSCIQVLRILITKADTEIDELEQDLIFLQSELAWIENEDWYEIGYNALTEKIDSLDTSMKSLRNGDLDDVEVHLLMHTRPVERLHEILKALLSNQFCKKDIQTANAGIKDCSRQSLKIEAGFSVEVIKSNSSCPISVKEQKVMQSLSSNFEDKGRHNAEKLEIQPTNVGVNNAISDVSKHANESSNIKNKSSISDSSIASGDFEEHSSISTAGLISSSSVKPMVIKTDAGEKDVDFGENVTAEKMECADEVNENENADPGLCMSSDPDKEEGPFDFTLNGKNEPTTEEVKVAASEIVTSLDSSVRTEIKEKNHLQILKVVEAALTEKENCALTLLLERQDKEGNNAMKVQVKEEEKSIPEAEMNVIVADEKFNSDLPLDSVQDLQKEKMKGSMKSNPQNLHEGGITKMIVDSSSSFVMKGKKRQKSVGSAGSNPERKIVKKEEEEGRKYEFGENGDGRANSVYFALKKTKSWISEVECGRSESSDKDDLTIEPIPIPSKAELEKMKVPELRNMAKQYKMMRLGKRKKEELVGMLLEHREKEQRQRERGFIGGR